MSEPYLVIEDLRRRFGRRLALRGLSLSIPRHAVCAFVGANGAGKTTTFSIIGQFIKPHGGRVLIEGQPLYRFRSEGGVIGLLPQDVQFYESRTIARQLYMFARLAGFGRAEAAEEVERVLALADLSDRAGDSAANLSRGMKVRLGVAQALVGRPPLIILDEPTAGLDPRMQLAFRRNIEAVRGTATIVISSHDLRELQELCDYVCIIDEGRLVRQGPMSEILGAVSRVVYHLEGFARYVVELADHQPGVRYEVVDERTLQAHFDPRVIDVPTLNQRVLGWALERGVKIHAVDARRSLEESYLAETS